MNKEELDRLLHENTPRERYYLEHLGKPSPRYETMERKTINNREVFCFSLPLLTESELLIRKDSRYTFVPFYIHTNINLNYIYSGECTYLIDDKMIKLHQGDVCIFDTNVIRAKEITGEHDIVINISMSNEFFRNTFNHMKSQSIMAWFVLSALSKNESHDHYLVFRSEKSPRIIDLFQNLLSEYFTSQIYSKEIIQAYLSIIFMELMRLYHVNSGQHLIQISEDRNKDILDILHYIEKNYKTCTLDELSTTFGYHPKYLSFLIRNKTGKSFKQIQLAQRLNIAAAILKNTAKPIHEIADSVGISNLNYFYKKFNEQFHASPNEYRKSQKKWQ